MKIYETEIYGRIPDKTPAVSWRVTEIDERARDGAAVMKKVAGTIGTAADAPQSS